MRYWTSARSELANGVKDGLPAERIEELRRDYRAARAYAYLRDLIAADPPLTAAQRRELADVLVGADPGGRWRGWPEMALDAADLQRARELAASAPPLSPSQREQLRLLLAGHARTRERGGEHAA